MSKDIYTTWKDIVERIARFVSYDFPDVEAEDLEQDLWVEILERGINNPDDHINVMFLKKFAKSTAMRYRAEHLILSPQYNYRVSDVRRILETVFEYNSWIQLAEREESNVGSSNRTNRELSYSLDDIIVSHSDVKRAWERMPHQYKTAIFERYALGDVPPNGTAKRRQLNRAEVRLTETLNTYTPRSNHQGPGSRKIANNALARYIIDTNNN